MRAQKTAILLAITIGLIVLPGFGQSLGEVARQQRQKQQAKDAHPAHKIITNEDLPAHPESEPSAASLQDEKRADASIGRGEKHANPPAPGSPSDPGAAEQWKATIQAQKNAVASMQGEIEKLRDSIHFVEANRYYNGVEYNQDQLRKQQEVERLQKQLDGEKKKLEEMQESARKAGFGSAVYDP
ncbi:MAG: hypothetical protein LAO03_01920 [Acidobacteriia bacterium]|nr:hypothetical protein [Terriglobia bacterium]